MDQFFGGGGLGGVPGMGGLGGVGAEAGGPEPLVKFACGKMTSEPQGAKWLVTGLPEAGFLQVVKTEGLLHFQWLKKKEGDIVDDFILFPDDAEFKKVNTGREKDRVYMLQWKSDGDDAQRLFYWMQHLKADEDEDNMRRVNEAIASAGTDQDAGQEGALGLNAFNSLLMNANTAAAQGAQQRQGGLQLEDLQNLLGSMDMPTATAAGEATPAPEQPPASAAAPEEAPASNEATAAAPATASDAAGGGGGGGGLTQADLQRAMMGLAANMGLQQQRRAPSMPLSEVLNSEDIEGSGLLEDEAAVRELLQHLPEGDRTPEGLRQTLRSPQFRGALGQLTSALNSDSYNSIMANFGLDPASEAAAAAMARGDTVEAFLMAVVAAFGAARADGAGEEQGGAEGSS